MVDVSVRLQEEHLPELHRFLGELLEDKAEQPATEPATGLWTVPVASKAISHMLDAEKALLRRVAEARGRRVPMAELSEALGLPAAPELAQDFPDLSKFCAAGSVASHPPMPVCTGGTGESAWYWMSPDDSAKFRLAFQQAGAPPKKPAQGTAPNGQ